MSEPLEKGAPTAAPHEKKSFANNSVQMLRTVQGNTMALSQMADQKASILMGATFVVFSISVSRALTQDVPVSLLVLAVFSFLSSLCAVVAILPSLSPPKKGAGGPVNRLFFGHYTSRAEDEWADDVIEQMQDEEKMFRMMLRDIYQNGQVLHRRKFRYLTYAYRLFVMGLMTTVLVFAFEIAAVL